MKRIVVSCICLLMLSACTFDILHSPKDSSYVYRSDGTFVTDCNGGGFGKNVPLELERFWKDNNLPYGTLDFKCDENNKPYMPENAPQPNKKK